MLVKVDGGRNMLHIFWRSDVYDAGQNEDGETVIGEVAFLMAEDADGERWIGPNMADTVTLGSLKRKGSASRKAVADMLRLYKRAVCEGEFDPRDAWARGRPCYGSPAYVLSGGDERWQEDDR